MNKFQAGSECYLPSWYMTIRLFLKLDFIFTFSFTSNKVGTVLLPSSGSLCAFLNWLGAGERKAVRGAPKPSQMGSRAETGLYSWKKLKSSSNLELLFNHLFKKKIDEVLPKS